MVSRDRGGVLAGWRSKRVGSWRESRFEHPADPNAGTPFAGPGPLWDHAGAQEVQEMTNGTTLDRWGCPLSEDGAGAEAVQEATAAYLTMAPGVDRHFPALEAGGPMAKALLAQFLVQAHKAPMAARASELSDLASAEADQGTISDRERGHLAATAAWVRGDLDGAIAAFDTILADHPTDVLALRANHLLLFNGGRVPEMLDQIQQVRPAWSDDLPLASLLDGQEAFALEESGRYREAETAGRRGVERDETDLWAIHAVSHVLQMEGRREEGVAWLQGRDPVLEAGGSFSGHLWWHQALPLLVLGRTDEVLDLYDRRVYQPGSEEGLDLSNAVALLARLEIAGVSVGERWQALAGPCSVRRGQHSHPFNDTHFALALSRVGDETGLAEHLAGMAAWSERDDHAGEVLRVVGLATARGLSAWGRGEWADAVTHLAPVAEETWRLGGSHAQRDVYRQILDHATRKAAA